MKREIKFRAWDKKACRMFPVYGIGPDFVTEDTLDGVDPGRNCFASEDFFYRISVMQFTGLLDKNGKEIYEGDIVAFPRHGWEEDQFVDKIYWSNRAGGWNINSILAPTSEVIGNIYENPELLEQ